MKITVKEMTLVSMFAAFACAGGLMLRLGGTGIVPFSILPLVVLLAGLLLGARLGAMVMVIYLAIGLIGVPVFSAPPFGGLAYLVKPTAGFLFGFIGGAFVTGKVVEQFRIKSAVGYIFASIAGLAVIYLIGLPYLYIVLNYYIGKAVSVVAVFKIGFLPFIGFDLIKALITSIIAVQVSKQVKAGRSRDN